MGSAVVANARKLWTLFPPQEGTYGKDFVPARTALREVYVDDRSCSKYAQELAELPDENARARHPRAWTVQQQEDTTPGKGLGTPPIPSPHCQWQLDKLRRDRFRRLIRAAAASITRSAP